MLPTDHLWNLESRILRGEVWDLYRRPGRRDREECWGDHIDDVNPQLLRTDVDFRAAVARLYRNLPIEWGKTPSLGAPQTLAPSVWVEAPPVPHEKNGQSKDVPKVTPRLPGETANEWATRNALLNRDRENEGGIS